MVTRHAGLAVRTGGEVATLFAHAAVHTRAVAVTLARCGRRYTERERGLWINTTSGPLPLSETACEILDLDTVSDSWLSRVL